jgi:DNA-directed RNA polymerase beta' subunit
MDNLNEIFIPPTSLKPIIKIDGTMFYGSDKLNNKILKLISKNKKTKSSSNKFKKLINNNELLPCFITKKFFEFTK